MVIKIPRHLAYVATLPCETFMSAKQAINDKLDLQGNAATYFRRGGVVNHQVLLSLSVIFFKSVNILQSCKQEGDCLMHFLRLLAV